MKIKIGKYFLSPEVNAKDRFNIYWERGYIDKTTGELARVREGYGHTLESAIAKVIKMRLYDNKEVVSLKEFLAAYKKEKEEVLNMMETC